jgi:hypothetical protein
VPGLERITLQAGRHRPAVLGADFLRHRLGIVRRQSRQGTTEQGQDEVVGADRELGDCIGHRQVTLGRTAGATPGDLAGVHLEVTAGGEFVEVVAGHVRVDAHPVRDRRGGHPVVAAVVADEQVDAAPRRVAEGVGDRRHGRGERGAAPHGGRFYYPRSANPGQGPPEWDP